MGFGVYSLIASSELKDQIIIGDKLRDEVGIEAYYNFAITPWLQVSADLQWIASGVTSNDDALVLGVRRQSLWDYSAGFLRESSRSCLRLSRVA